MSPKDVRRRDRLRTALWVVVAIVCLLIFTGCNVWLIKAGLISTCHCRTRSQRIEHGTDVRRPDRLCWPYGGCQ